MSQKLDCINHPGDTIGITGFFLNNTRLGIIAMLTGHQDKSVKLYTKECEVVSPVFIRCLIPSRLQMYGYYMVSLYEKDTLYKLNDENLLQILVLPRPVISTTSMTSYVTTMSDDQISGMMNS